MENLDYPFSLIKSRKKKMVKIEEGVMNGFFYILFPVAMI